MKNYNLTKLQIAFFWNRFAYWADYFGLTKCWQLHYNEMNDNQAFYAAVSTSHEDGMAVVHLCTVWDVKPTKTLLDKSAFHETLHLLLAPMDKEDDMITQEHVIIRTLENTVWKEISEYGET